MPTISYRMHILIMTMGNLLKKKCKLYKKSIDQDKNNHTWPSIKIIQHSIYILDRRKICIGLLYDTSYLGILQHYRNIPSTEKREMT